MRQRIASLGSLVLGTTVGGAGVGALEGVYRSVSPAYAAALYACLWGLAGSALAVVSVAVGARWRRRRVLGAGLGTWGAVLATSTSALLMVPYIVRRDLLQQSVDGWWAAASAALGAASIAGALTMVLGRLLTPRLDAAYPRAWLTPLAAASVFATLVILGDDPRRLGAPPGAEALTAHHALVELLPIPPQAEPPADAARSSPGLSALLE